MADGVEFKINFKDLEILTTKLKSLDSQISNSIERLSFAAYNQAVSITKEKLKNSSNQLLFLDNLKFEKTQDGKYNAYLIIVDKSVLWLENGAKSFSLKDTLNGQKSRIIPFNHNKNQPSNMSTQQASLYKEIKTALRSNNIPLRSPIVNSAGQPILSSPTKPRAAAMIKKVSSSLAGKASGESVLNRLNIYQHQNKNGGIDKAMITFRTLTKDSKSPWEISGREGIKILDQVYVWLMTNYERILNEGLKNLQVSLG